METLTDYSVQEQTSQLMKLGWAVNPGVPGYSLPDTLKRFQLASLDADGKQLDADGEFGPKTAGALFGYSDYTKNTLIERVLAVARSQIGISEVPSGSNKGPQIAQVLKSVGLSEGYAWCAAFTYWCFMQAARQKGAKNPSPKSAGVLNLWSLAGFAESGLTRITNKEATNNPSLVKPGMQFILKVGSSGAGHTGLVESVSGNKLTTIEGNTNQELSREGTGVFRLTRRTIQSINVGFIDYTS